MDTIYRIERLCVWIAALSETITEWDSALIDLDRKRERYWQKWRALPVGYHSQSALLTYGIGNLFDMRSIALSAMATECEQWRLGNY